MRVQLRFLAIAVFVGNACAGKLPTFIKPCSKSDPKLDQCVKAVIEKVLPEFVKGIPALDIEPLDPANIGTVVVNNPALKITLANTVITGLGEAAINSYKVDLAKDRTIIDTTANVTIKADYDIDGKILVLPIKGNGKAKIKITNLNIVLIYNFKTVNGHWVMVGHKDTYKMDHAHFKFTNLFNGNKELGDTTNKFLNDNWSTIMNEVAPPAIEQIVEYILKQTGKLFDAVPIEELLLP